MPDAFISTTTSPEPGVGSGKFINSSSQFALEYHAAHRFLPAG